MFTPFIEFRQLEKFASQNKQRFLSLLKKLITNLDCVESIKLLKASGICVNIYGTGKNAALYSEAIKELKSHFGTDTKEINEFCEQVNILDTFFSKFIEKRHELGLHKIHTNKQISAFLICSDILLSSLLDYMKDSTLEEINEKYPFFAIPVDGDGNIASAFDNPMFLSNHYENIVASLCSVIHYMLFTGAKQSGITKSVKFENIRTSRLHFILIAEWNFLNRIHDCWRYIGCSFQKDSEDNFQIFPEDINFLKSIFISNNRYLDQTTKWMNEHLRLKDHIPTFPNTSKLPPLECRSFEEHLTSLFCMEYFKTSNLESCISDIPLSNWIRSYYVISVLAEEYLNNRDSFNIPKISEFLLVLRKNEIINEFENAGIPKQNCDKILNTLMFHSKSLDLLDTPIIPIDMRFVLLPSVAAKINPSRSMLSNFATRGFDLSKRGYRFEEIIRKEFNSVSITCKELNVKDNSDEYQCDGVFILEDSLFFIEAKCFLPPSSVREHYEHLNKLHSATEQLNRIADFYVSNLKHVQNTLNLSKTWSPTSHYRIILTNTMNGRAEFHNKCYILDESALDRFMQRDPIGFTVGDVRVVQKGTIYEGDITKNKFISLLKILPPSIVYSENIETIDTAVNLGDISVAFPVFNRKIPSFSYVSKDNYEKLLSMLSENSKEALNQNLNIEER